MHSDQWIEQGSDFWTYSGTTGQANRVTFLKIFKTDMYYHNVISSWGGNSGWQYFGGVWITDTTISSMNIYHALGTGSNNRLRWLASGY